MVQITVQLNPLQPTLSEHMLLMVSFSAFLSRTILQDSLTTITFSSEGFVCVLKNSSREWRHFRKMYQKSSHAKPTAGTREHAKHPTFVFQKEESLLQRWTGDTCLLTIGMTVKSLSLYQSSYYFNLFFKRIYKDFECFNMLFFFLQAWLFPPYQGSIISLLSDFWYIG